MTVKKIFRIDKGTMKRSLKILDVFSVGYGDLGSSIYYALGITAIFALGATPIALVLAGVVFCFTALTYAEMSSVVPDSGGSASFSRKAFNDLISFFAGWALLLDYIVTIAISAFSVGPYLKFFLPFLANHDSNIVFTLGVIAFLLIINIIGTHYSTRLSSYLTIATILTQFVIIIVGFFTLVHFKEFFFSLAIGSANPNSPSWGEFFKGVAMAMVAYTGIESMAQLSSETKNPSRAVPKAMILVTIVLIISYIGLSTVALSVMSPTLLSTTYMQDPITGIAMQLPVIGPWLSSWVGLVGGIILFAAANSGLLGASRVSFNLGEYCQLPKAFYYLQPKFRTPSFSLIVFAVIAVLIVIWSRGSLAFLGDLYNFGAQLAFLSAHLSLIMHRIQYPNAKRPFKLWLNIKIKGREIPLTAILGAVLNLSVWILVVVTKKEGRELGLLWLLIGLVFYVILRRHHQIGITESVEIKKIKMDHFEKLSLKKILVPLQNQEEEVLQVAFQFAKEQNALVTCLYLIEVAEAIPFSVAGKKQDKAAEVVFEKAQAMAKEYNLDLDFKEILSRSTADSIIDLAKEGKYDLIVMAPGRRKRISSPFSLVTEKVVQKATCKVWVCRKELS